MFNIFGRNSQPMDGFTLSRGALSAEQCCRLAAAVDEKAGRITVPPEVGRLLGDVGTTQVPCKTATGPVREHLDRYADGSPVPGIVNVVYVAVDGACSLVLSPAGGGDEIRIVLEQGLRVAWENSKFQHRVDCAPEARRIMLGPAARRGKGLEAVGYTGPPFPKQSLETPTQMTVFIDNWPWRRGALSTSLSRPSPFDPGFLAHRGVPPDIVAALARSLGSVPTITTAQFYIFGPCPPCWLWMIKARMDFDNGLKRAVQTHAQAFANVGVQLSLKQKPMTVLDPKYADDAWDGIGLEFAFVNAAAPGMPSPPGAEAMDPLVRQQRVMAVTVPPGTQPGAVISAQAPDGTVVQCTVPNPVPPCFQVAY